MNQMNNMKHMNRMNQTNTINIMYAGDCGMEKGILLSAISVCRNTKRETAFYILTADFGKYRAIDGAFAEKLSAVTGSHVTVIDMSEQFSRYLPHANLSTRFTPLCMLRLFADKAREVPDRILYLDADVLCRGDIAPLYGADMGNCDFLGVPDRYGKWFFSDRLKHNYLNSGVLLLDMKKIRENGLFEKCRKLCAEEKMFMPDQSALNRLGRKGKLDRIYNEQGKIRSDTVLKHFTTYFVFFPRFKAVTVKPWNTELMHEKLHIYEFDYLFDSID